MTKDDYVQLLKNLMPRGAAWARGLGTNFHRLFEAMAEEMSRLDTRAGVDLLNEVDPTTTSELLSDYERVYEITATGTTQDRRAALVQKMTAKGGQSRKVFIDLAALLGFVVTIQEFKAFKVGRAKAGDPLTNGDWVYTWRVKAPAASVKYFKVGLSRAGDPLASWGNGALEAEITKKKPAHTIVQFAYG